MKPFISTSVYGLFNYLVAITLMTSPWLFGFVHVGGASLFLPLIFGWLQLIMAIFGRQAMGFIKVFPVSMHCFIDVVAGSFLMMSPFVYTYSVHVWAPQFILGGLVVFFGIFTKESPLTDEPNHVIHDGLLGSADDVYQH